MRRMKKRGLWLILLMLIGFILSAAISYGNENVEEPSSSEPRPCFEAESNFTSELLPPSGSITLYDEEGVLRANVSLSNLKKGDDYTLILSLFSMQNSKSQKNTSSLPELLCSKEERFTAESIGGNFTDFIQENDVLNPEDSSDEDVEMEIDENLEAEETVFDLEGLNLDDLNDYEEVIEYVDVAKIVDFKRNSIPSGIDSIYAECNLYAGDNLLLKERSDVLTFRKVNEEGTAQHGSAEKNKEKNKDHLNSTEEDAASSAKDGNKTDEKEGSGAMRAKARSFDAPNTGDTQTASPMISVFIILLSCLMMRFLIIGRLRDEFA